ncbi:TPA: hypothetical protein DIC38_01190 [Candidatus Nomurabacteria bacterium]|nr:MAG: tRNA pseudouridine synthase B [Parcubacteria bacterium RAAC4_OD1_1]HCY26284.1 hypothetical protein [Candidatus Nomurabacteria bacterium]
MDNVIKIYKKKGETPLDCILNLKKNDERLRFLSMTYAGRLDPLAEGLLIILLGDEVYKKEEYLNLDKEYEVDILFGFATDTYDLMGKITDVLHQEFSGCPTSVISKFIGKINQSYPPYSSKTVDGKPLWQWAREGRIGEIEIPKHEVFIKNIEIIKEESYLGSELLSKIQKDIALVSGDFRQEEILKDWEEALENFQKENFLVLSINVLSSSGAYMRSLVNDIGKKIEVPTLALNIKRTKIGEYII